MLPKICFSVLAICLSLSAAEPVPIPAASVNAVTVGPGWVDQTIRQVVRTHNNVVYVMTADDAPCQQGGRGVIHIWKGTGAQPGNNKVPTSFVEQDAANRPTSVGSGSCIFSGGVTSMLLSPEIRLDANDVIHSVYMDGNNGNIYYQTFSTTTDTWGTRTVVGTGGSTTSGSGWGRTGQVSMSLDANDAPHIVYASAGTSNSIRYVNRASGSWSSPVTVASGTDIMHPCLVISLNNALHAIWLDSSLASHSSVKYSQSVAGGAWSPVETVTAGDSLVLNNSNLDQGPSLTTDRNNLPYVLYMDGTPNGSDNYVRMRYRTAAGLWQDNTPPGTSGGASNPNGTWYAHSPQAYTSLTGDIWVFLGHDVNISSGVYAYQAGGPGHTWSPAAMLDPRNSTNTTAGAPGLDGSASVRFDPLRDNNPDIIDVIIFDENDGTTGYDHHATVYYKAIILNTAPDTTPPTPPANLAAVPISAAQVSLTWTASTDDGGVSGYKVFRDGAQVATATATAFADSGLAAGTSYSYSVLAFDFAGNESAPSGNVSATTLAPDTLPPTVPTGFSATPVGSSGMNISWLASSDNVAISGYRLFRNGTQLAVTSTTNYKDSGLTPSTTYVYLVEAIDSSGNVSTQRASATATLPAAVNQTYTLFGSAAPTAADSGSSSSIEVGVKFTADINGQITAIRFYKSTRNTGTHTVALWSSTGSLLAGATATGETSSGWQTVAFASPVTIVAGRTYTASYHAPAGHSASDRSYFAVKYDRPPLHAPASAGVYATSSSRVYPTRTSSSTNYWVDVVLSAAQTGSDTVSPSTPSSLTATPESSAKVNLNWTASTDNVGVAGYKVYRQGTQINTSATNAYSDTGVATGATYSYAVSAYDAVGNSSALSVEASASVPSSNDTVPPVLSNITASSITASSATISWVTNETADTQVEFGDSALYGSSSTLVSSLTTSHAVALTGLTASTTYHYRVKSRDSAGNLATSADGTFTTAPPPDTAAPTTSITSPTDQSTVSGSITVAAGASDPGGVAKVEFYLDSVLKSTATVAPYTWTFDTTQASNGAHTLLVKAYDASGNVGTSASVAITISNAAPATIALVQRNSGSVVTTSLITLTLPSAVAAGDLIVVGVSSWPSAPAATAITDTLGNTYALAGTTRKTSYGAYTGIYYTVNTRAGSNTVTFRTASGGSELSMVVAEFSGANAVSPLDAATGATGSSATPSSGNMTPTAAGDLVIGVGTHDGTDVTSAGSGFTLVAVTNENSNTYQPLAMDYKIQATTAAVAATFSLSKSDSWAQAGALFKR